MSESIPHCFSIFHSTIHCGGVQQFFPLGIKMCFKEDSAHPQNVESTAQFRCSLEHGNHGNVGSSKNAHNEQNQDSQQIRGEGSNYEAPLSPVKRCAQCFEEATEAIGNNRQQRCQERANNHILGSIGIKEHIVESHATQNRTNQCQNLCDSNTFHNYFLLFVSCFGIAPC